MSIESTEHFLIHCNLYTEIRFNMFQIINPILESNGLHLPNGGLLMQRLLYGHKTFSVEDNSTVLSATLNYIQNSTRFDLADE